MKLFGILVGNNEKGFRKRNMETRRSGRRKNTKRSVGGLRWENWI